MSVLVVAWVGADNLGDELICARLVQRLKAAGVPRVTVTSADVSRTERRYGVNAIHYANVPAVYRAVRQSRLVILGGGGLIQDQTSVWSPSLHLGKLLMANQRGVPVIALGLGVGPLTLGLNRRLTARALRPARRIVVRDEASKRILEGCGVRRVDVGLDLVLDEDDGARVRGQRSHLLACLRPPIASRRSLPAVLRAPAADRPFVEALAAQLDAASAAIGVPVVFVSFEPRRDDALHRDVGRLMKRPWTMASSEPASVESLMSGAVGLVGMRYHALLLALARDVPVVALPYATKVESLMQESGRQEFCLPLTPAGLHRLAETLGRAIATPVERRPLETLRRQRGGRNWEALADALSTMRPSLTR